MNENIVIFDRGLYKVTHNSESFSRLLGQMQPSLPENTSFFVFLIIGSQDTEKDMRIRDVQQRLGRVGRLVGGIYADGCGNNGTFPIGTHTDEQARLVGKPIAGITAVARSDLVGRAIVETAYEMVNGQLVSVTSDNVIVCTPDTADDDLVAQVGLKARVPVTIERAFLDDISAV